MNANTAGCSDRRFSRTILDHNLYVSISLYAPCVCSVLADYMRAVLHFSRAAAPTGFPGQNLGFGKLSGNHAVSFETA